MDSVDYACFEALIPYWARRIPHATARCAYYAIFGSCVQNPPIGATGWWATGRPWSTLEGIVCDETPASAAEARAGLQWLIRERIVVAPDGAGPGQPTFLIYADDALPAALLHDLLRFSAEREAAENDLEVPV